MLFSFVQVRDAALERLPGANRFAARDNTLSAWGALGSDFSNRVDPDH
jgi:hypothetical protein